MINSKIRPAYSGKPIKSNKRRYTIFTDIYKNSICYLLLLPAALYTFIYGYASLPWLLIAFQKYKYRTGIFGSEWVGFKNFEFFFKSTSAWTVTRNTVYLNVLFITTGTIVAVFLAIIMNEVKSKWFAKITQSTLIFPQFISWVVVSYFAYMILSMDGGLMNQMLKVLKIPPVNWYQTPEAWPWILVVIKLWKGAGIGAVIYLAAITGFDNEVYEAASIDGCTRWQQIKFITIPLLVPTITMLTLLSIGGIFRGDFQLIYTLVRDNGVLMPATDVIDTYVFRSLRLVGDASNATAVGLYQAVVGFLFVWISNKLARKYCSDGALF